MALHVHKDQTDQLSLIEVGNEFVQWSDHRRHLFGKFFTTWLTVVIFCFDSVPSVVNLISYYNTEYACESIFYACLASPLFICFPRHCHTRYSSSQMLHPFQNTACIVPLSVCEKVQASTYASTGCHCPSRGVLILVFWHSASALNVWPGVHLCELLCSQWECFARGSPLTYSWQNLGPDGWSSCVHQTGCKECTAWKFSEADHLHHPFWLFLLQQITIQHQQSSQVFLMQDECNPGWTQRCTVPPGGHFHLWTWLGWTQRPTACCT